MFVSRDREKLLNAIIYFAGATKHCHTLKLYKLLNFSDMEHFRQTGRSIFNLKYLAFDKGPVPTDLRSELDKGGYEDMRKLLLIKEERDHITKQVKRRDFKGRVAFDKKFFSKREIKIIELIAEFFRDLKGEDMSEFSHMRGLPWRAVYKKGEGRNLPIPDDLSLEAEAIMKDVPTIDRREMEYRREILSNNA